MPAPGFLEGKYEVVAKIREGGMGAVYKVRHRLLNELRVVKVMHSQVASSPEQRKRFVREAQTATRLKHPNIVAFYDFAVDPDGTAYMVMEYIDGTDLADLVRRLGPMPVPIGLSLMRQCLSALGYLHKRGIVHRDVSPDNILLCRDEDGAPQAKLIDLGIAKVARDQENLTAADEFLGKLRYASPEQLTAPADGPIDGRSDIYSLGAAVYELLTGVCAFRGKSLQSILAAHLTGSPVPFSESDPKDNVPLGLRRALIRSLEIAPEERFQTAEEFLGDIDSLPQRATPEETDEFLMRALGAPHPLVESPSAIVDLPPPTGEIEPRTEAGGPATGPGAPEATAAWPPTRAFGMPAPAPPRPASERTELYRPRAAPPATPGGPSRVSPLVYAAILGAAAIGLGLLWLRSAGSSEKTRRKNDVTGRTPAAVTVTRERIVARPSPVPELSPTSAPPAPTEAPTPVPAPTSPPWKFPGGFPARSPREKRFPSPPADEKRGSPGSVESATRYCATWEKTSYAQGAIKEKPPGFTTDSAPAFRGPRTDAARIHIDVAIRPEKPGEEEPFRVTARIVNEGDIDLVLDQIEESAERQEGGFRPVEGKGPVTVSVGGFSEIYRYEGYLAAGATYRKDLRVVDRFGDSWRTSVRIVPCE
jgi:serine/threonine-protein kinase